MDRSTSLILILVFLGNVSLAVKDLNECQDVLNFCRKRGTCSYTCKCNAAHLGDGFNCYNSYSGLGHSAILANDNKYLEKLKSWLESAEQSQSPYWKRCWRASVDGWASYTFHSLCDNKGPTVTIIRVGNYIFGGYTSTSWTSDVCGFRYSSTAFLFSLVNKPGWGPIKLSQIGPDSGYQFSIFSCSLLGPTFGRQQDILIASDAPYNTDSYSNLGHTYRERYFPDIDSPFARSFLAGTFHFKPDEVEVFYETN